MRARIVALVVVALVAVQPQRPQAQVPARNSRLFPPLDLGLLEGPDRDEWQKPDQIMDALGIADSAAVADLGCGAGWFTIRLARRVGPNGLVYAEDVQTEMIRATERRAQREGLRNVRPILGTEDDPKLPASRVDAVLIVDAYHEIVNPVALLRNVGRALKPSGRIGIIDFTRGNGGPGPPSEERVDPAIILRDAQRAGLRFFRQESFLPFQYLLILGK